jgi:hypothetical protein
MAENIETLPKVVENDDAAFVTTDLLIPVSLKISTTFRKTVAVTFTQLKTLLSGDLTGKEDAANKTGNITDFLTSTVKFWHVKGVVDYLTSHYTKTSDLFAIVFNGLSATNATVANGDTLTQVINKIIGKLLAVEAKAASAFVVIGAWDASGGVFPGGGTAKNGYVYTVSVAGTVDGVSFSQNDRIVATVDNASTTTFTGNWFKEDYTDLVTSVMGQTGAVTGLVTPSSTDTLTNKTLVRSINTQTGTSYTLVLSDSSAFVRLNNAAPNTIEIPTNSLVAFPIGVEIPIQQIGAGQTTIVAAGGVTINAVPGLKLTDQYAAASLVKVATDTWTAIGRLSA